MLLFKVTLYQFKLKTLRTSAVKFKLATSTRSSTSANLIKHHCILYSHLGFQPSAVPFHPTVRPSSYYQGSQHLLNKAWAQHSSFTGTKHVWTLSCHLPIALGAQGRTFHVEPTQGGMHFKAQPYPQRLTFWVSRSTSFLQLQSPWCRTGQFKLGD